MQMYVCNKKGPQSNHIGKHLSTFQRYILMINCAIWEVAKIRCQRLNYSQGQARRANLLAESSLFPLENKSEE